jgi:hypothetical protein
MTNPAAGGVILGLDPGIQAVFNVNTKDRKVFVKKLSCPRKRASRKV